MRLTVAACAFLLALRADHRTASAFVVPQSRTAVGIQHSTASVTTIALYATADDADGEKKEEEDKPVNPYADPNYPDLEFVNYNDPDYQIDMGIGDDFATAEEEEKISSALSPEEANAAIEEMREDRRRRNDEFQFETYHASALKSGEKYRGEWEVYRTSTFIPGQEDRVNEYGMPSLVKAKRVLKMISSGKKVGIESKSGRRVDGERIVHEELQHEDEDVKTTAGGEDGPMDEYEEFEAEIRSNKYWPDMLGPYDFRGEQGIMCVGNAYTICDAIPLENGSSSDDADVHEGPFSELRTEIGLFHKKMRMRLKFDYRVKEADVGSSSRPPLALKSMTVCREGHERWPRYSDEQTNVDNEATAALFGPPGAAGGLYDPPPVGSDDQATRYMMLDLEGGATVLFPHTIDQDPEAFNGNGWVTSLDWTPGRIRYQVDRKVLGGTKIKGLKTLELSEVQGADAKQYRPKDGGSNMRQ
mmetsp:Transcript_34472/g.69632  ORF Transcript_34472/g.69632 Transcript_34472/m.69632 type:complete len:473 (+) Transcript_34472:1952-3370(+)|eukprot:CAMPEP_0178689290 /NCGR_PEP_ID=MMETSP0699-20121125/5459_1 /TAXON_ID=265572 /ORGANISM="Extubocellulus spinifer, Strain CCMP396" /LENGTH=472 /DNA_ID=CAMNT_0020334343 /DNA_START=2017 /DNA_END=3435 /DNA_ORIENTATION=-